MSFVGIKTTFSQDDSLEVKIYNYLKSKPNGSKYIKFLISRDMFNEDLITDEEFLLVEGKLLNVGKGKDKGRIDYAFIEYIDKLKVLRKQNGHCKTCYCEITTTDLNLGTHWNLDHIYPLSHGGLHAGFNVQILCRTCNLSKTNHMYEVPTAHRKLCEDNNLLYSVSTDDKEKERILQFLIDNKIDFDSLYGE